MTVSPHLTDFEVEAAVNIVTVGWVAKHYNVPRLAVYRAIKERRLSAIRLATSNTYLLDRRNLPEKFPRSQ